MDKITVRLLHPVYDRVCTLEMSRNARFSELTPILYDQGFILPQKPGYRYLYQEHLCGMEHELGDYIPESASEIELKIFDVPVIMV